MVQTSTRENTWNKVIFTGNLGKDPDMKYTPMGNAVTRFSIAVSQGKDKQGNAKDPLWLNVVTWNELAEQCNKKLEKGSRIQLEGRLAPNVWEKDGQTHYGVEVVAFMVKPIKSSKTGNASPTGFIDDDGDLSGDDGLGDLDDHPF
jgi:single-strand DNA-binding protein